MSIRVMPDAAERLNRWIETLVRRGGSDLFLVVGLPPSIRVTGKVMRLDEPPLDGDVIEQAVLAAIPAAVAEKYRRDGYADASIRRPGLGRFRVNLHHERERPAATIRALAAHP